jgi:A/G-specific adenine glycosylase
MLAAPFDPYEVLLDWYGRNQRTLPWRSSPTPYAVLVSELMLQQTQVDRVVPYFERFVARFPSFESLAAAPRAEVIRLWSGLGYNRRAVHLHEAAKVVVDRHGGKLPRDRLALEALPGIGPYTAGAVLSIAFGEAEAAPDTNVRRVVSRYALGDGEDSREIDDAVRGLVPAAHAGDWNQALMDLGSAICLSRKPRCLLCPLRPGCRSAGQLGGATRKLPRASDAFAGSSRFYRGHLLRALTELPVETVVPMASLSQRLAVNGVAEPRVGWQAVGEALALDGLARLEPLNDGNGIGIGLA